MFFARIPSFLVEETNAVMGNVPAARNNPDFLMNDLLFCMVGVVGEGIVDLKPWRSEVNKTCNMTFKDIYIPPGFGSMEMLFLISLYDLTESYI